VEKQEIKPLHLFGKEINSILFCSKHFPQWFLANISLRYIALSESWQVTTQRAQRGMQRQKNKQKVFWFVS